MILCTSNTPKTKAAFLVHSMKRSTSLKKLKIRNRLMSHIGNLFLKRLINLDLKIAMISMRETSSQASI